MRPLAAVCLLPLTLAGCLEHEETITVRPDGSLDVTLLAKGDAADLCTGYALPFSRSSSGMWSARNDGAQRWLETMAPDTGGPRAHEQLAELQENEADDLQLVVGAEFASAADLPRWFAPETEPYRSAYLARGAELTIERKGPRTVYTFERVYHGRQFAPWDINERARKKLHPDLMKKVESGFEFADEEWPVVAEALGEAFVEAGIAFVRSAFSSIYTEGDASVAPAALRRALDEATGSLRAVGSRAAIDRLRELVEKLRRLDENDGNVATVEAELGDHLRMLRREGRSAMRAAIDVALEEAGADTRIRNAVHARLEWTFTSFDHTDDLTDEKFTLRVQMPGVIVDGNFDRLDGEVALWGFEGRDLRDSDRVMRVVSVL